MFRRLPPVVCTLLAIGIALFARGADELADSDKQLLKGAGVAVDGPALLAFFRQRTINEASRARVAKLIEQLGHDDFDIREKATRELTALGAQAEPALRQAASAPDAEIADRARRCLEGRKSINLDVVAAAARVLVATKEPQWKNVPPVLTSVNDGILPEPHCQAPPGAAVILSRSDDVLATGYTDNTQPRRPLERPAPSRLRDGGA